MEYYILLKAFHIVAVIIWCAALIFLSIFFMNYAKYQNDKNLSKEFITLWQNIYKYIGTIGMLFSIKFGILMLYFNQSLFYGNKWIHVKIVLVVLLLFYHHLCGIYLKQISENSCIKSKSFFWLFGCIALFLVVCIVILAVTKFF